MPRFTGIKATTALASILAGAWVAFLASAPVATSETERLYVTQGANAVLKAERAAAAERVGDLEAKVLPNEEFERLDRADGMGADNTEVVLAQLRLRAELQAERARMEVGREAENAFWRSHYFTYGFREVAIRGYRASWFSDVVAMMVPPPHRDWPTGMDAWRWADELVPAEYRERFRAEVAGDAVVDTARWGRVITFGMPVEAAADLLAAAKTWSQAAALRHRIRSAEFDSAILRANAPVGAYLWAFPILAMVATLVAGRLLSRVFRRTCRPARPI